MGIVVSMLLIAVGAVMRFAVTVEGKGFNVHTTGVILLVIGIIGALLSIGFWASWGGFGNGGRRGTMVGSSGVVTGQRTTVTERDVL